LEQEGQRKIAQGHVPLGFTQLSTASHDKCILVKTVIKTLRLVASESIAQNLVIQ
jgi:hypothetical protein